MSLWAAGLSLLLSVSPGLAPQPATDFSGRWKLVEQETSAWMGRSSTGAHEEDLAITQSENRLAVAFADTDGAWDFAYSIAPPPAGDRGDAWSAGHWENGALVTVGRRTFRSSKGPVTCDFEERRSLSSDGARMTVVLRLKMFPKDLVRTSAYERVE
ncbi:MAG: hypothetical protein AMXMBFR53_35560 [Gemmatimonadota bacterium]